jgi:hypothetical protein
VTVVLFRKALSDGVVPQGSLIFPFRWPGFPKTQPCFCIWRNFIDGMTRPGMSTFQRRIILETACRMPDASNPKDWPEKRNFLPTDTNEDFEYRSGKSLTTYTYGDLQKAWERAVLFRIALSDGGSIRGLPFSLVRRPGFRKTRPCFCGLRNFFDGMDRPDMATFQLRIILNVACRTLEGRKPHFSGPEYANPIVGYPWRFYGQWMEGG